MPSYGITGASKGIGREFVHQISRDSPNVVFAIVRDVEAAIPKFPTSSNVHIIKGDVTDPVSLLEAAEQVSKINGGKPQLFRGPFTTAILGGLWATNAFLPLIEKGSEKKIVHISSTAADVGFVRTAGITWGVAYGVAKAGLNTQIARYAVELSPKGIKTLALSPGWVNTYEGPLPKSPELQQYQELQRSHYSKVYGDIDGPISPEASVRKSLQIIGELDETMSGQFLPHDVMRSIIKS
ncbi:hypothetical protein FSARC_13142 [Fusarium sarcochroum]|uniref:Oxidoreductase n=1 Tax=Fusarium sarcochroum TaxID=1208366 RepID=A0A8H4T3H2_9HYPO|nr:hypothetical protein FSARC_13142 [Fusarium sarcochroum]